MRPNSKHLIALTIFTGLIAGCGQVDNAQDEDWALDQTDSQTKQDPPKQDPPKQDTPNYPDKTDALTFQNASICAPQAYIQKAYDYGSVAPNLRQWILDAEKSGCQLNPAQGSTPSSKQLRVAPAFGNAGETNCDDQGCWQTLPSTTKTWREEESYDMGYPQGGGKWVGVIDARRETTTGELQSKLYAANHSSTAVQTFERNWNKSGNLIMQKRSFNTSVWFDATYTYENKRVVSINVRHQQTSQNNHGAYTYTYDDAGRLLTGEHTDKDSDKTHRVNWTYDEQGRPSQVIRSLDGQSWLTQQWTYKDSTNEIINFKSDFDATLVRSYPRFMLLDDHTPHHAMIQTQWDEDSYRLDTKRRCAELPTGLRYGYPEADNAYHLGWKVGKRPNGIDRYYGYPAAYASGDQGWIAHAGIEGGYIGGLNGNLGTDTTYENGVMMTSTISHSNIMEGGNPTEGTLIENRVRTFENGLLVLDTISGGEKSKALTFEYDDQQRLIKRTLSWDDDVVAQQRWTIDNERDSKCQTQRHEVGFSTKHFNNGWGIQSEPGHTQLDPAMDMRTAYTVDANADCTVQKWTQNNMNNNNVQTYHYDAKDQLIKYTINDYITRMAYTPDGQLSAITNTNTENELNTTLKHTFNDRGLITSRDWRYGRSDNRSEGPSETYTYTCK